MVAPANNLANPNTEKNAAHPAIKRAEIPTNVEKFFMLSNKQFLQNYINKYYIYREFLFYIY